LSYFLVICSHALLPALLAGSMLASPSLAAAQGGQTASESVSIHIAPNGRDSWTGSRDKPFATLARAQKEVRALRKNRDANVVVLIADGVYRLDQPLVLIAEDSGTKNKPVVWRAADGASPVISGGLRLSNWTLVDQIHGIYRAKFSGDTRQFYVNGTRAERATSPNFVAEDFMKTSTGFEVTGKSAAILAGVSRPQDLELTSNRQWRTYRCGVAALTTAGTGNDLKVTVTMDQPCYRNANLVFNKDWKFDQPQAVENAFEFIDEPGEWYLDRKAQWLYYKPRPGENLSNSATVAVAPVLEALVRGEGALGAPVHDIQFVGLTFADATWLHPSSTAGYVPDQSSYRYRDDGGDNQPDWGHPTQVIRTPGNVSFKYAQRISFSGSTFTRLGAAGLDFDTGSQENRVTASKFRDISGAAIQIGGVDEVDHHPSDPRQITMDNYVGDSSISYSGQEYVDGPGIMIGYTARTTIEHNYFAHLPYDGIQIGWGWGLSDPGGTPLFDNWTKPARANAGWKIHDKPTIATGSRITGNLFVDYMRKLNDGGAVYTLSAQGASFDDGLVIDRNVALGQVGYGFIWYTDIGTRYVTFRNNVGLGPRDRGKGPLAVGSIGGCAPFGDLRYDGNYVSEHPRGNAIPHYLCGSTSGEASPVRVDYRDNNKLIDSLTEAPQDIVNTAGPRVAGVYERPSMEALDAYRKNTKASAAVTGEAASVTNPTMQSGAKRHYSSSLSLIGDLLKNDATRAVVEKHFPGFATNDQTQTVSGLTIRALQEYSPEFFSDSRLAAFDADLAKISPPK